MQEGKRASVEETGSPTGLLGNPAESEIEKALAAIVAVIYAQDKWGSAMPWRSGGTDLLRRWLVTHVPFDQIARIHDYATEVLGDSASAQRWLSAANPATDGRSPIDLIGEPEGYERVHNLLQRIEYGVLA